MESIDLTKRESELRGDWIPMDGKLWPNGTCKRIEWLVEDRLEKICTDPSGWDLLLRDPRDGRLWERTYPQSELHGGGPPMLKVVTLAVAKSKYGVDAIEHTGYPRSPQSFAG